jgi:tRNA nucleotidyltransferase (CCA-adding enzyme)
MPDYMYMLESRLSAEQRAVVVRVQELAVETSTNIYLTGGAVRDLISGMPIRDLDFTVEGNPARIARELEKGGARTVTEDEKLRQIEIIFSGDVDGSISAARDDLYARPGTRPEIRWSTILEDLHRRDFSLNAIAISLNPASRGLLLDPTNGLADLERREVRALSIHSFTNQPVRLLRAARYCARMDFKLESRTEEWFALALERNLQESITPEDAGRELRQLAREDKPAQVLKAWEARGLLGAVSPQLAKRHPHYEMLARILRAREDLASAGLRPRLFTPVTYAVLGKLKDRERAALLDRLKFRAEEAGAVLHLEDEAQKTAKILAGRKTSAPGEAFAFLERTTTALMAFILAESSNGKAVSKIRTYLHKWRPLRQALPAAALELESIGMEHGPKFDKVIEDLFQAQLLGRGRTPELRIKLLRKLSGIKEPPKKKPDEKDKKKGGEKAKKKPVGKEAATPAAAVAGRASSKRFERAPAAEALSRLRNAAKEKQSGAKTPAKQAKPPASTKRSATRKR